MWYNSSDEAHERVVPSGAYIFRPDGAYGGGAPARVRIVEGPLLTEVHQVPTLPCCTLDTRSICRVSQALLTEVYQVLPLPWYVLGIHSTPGAVKRC